MEKVKNSETKKEKNGLRKRIGKVCTAAKPYVIGVCGGVAGMLVYRQYESFLIGRGFVRIIHNPELLALAQKSTEHLKGR